MSNDTDKGVETPRRRKTLKTFMGGSLLASEKAIRQLPFIGFLVLLCMLLIANRYWSEKNITRIEDAQDSIKNLRAQSVIYEIELMKMDRPSEVVEKVEKSGLGLIEPKEPAMRLKVKKTERN